MTVWLWVGGWFKCLQQLCGFLWFCSPGFHRAARGISGEFARDLPGSVRFSLLGSFLEVPLCANWTSVTMAVDQRWLCNGFYWAFSVSWYCGELHYPWWMLHQPRRVSCVRQLLAPAVKLHMWGELQRTSWTWHACSSSVMRMEYGYGSNIELSQFNDL